jgi:hypothetical protein
MAVTVTVPGVTECETLPRPAVATAKARPADLRAELEILQEPVELLAELKLVARDRPAAARACAPAVLAVYATTSWGTKLDELGIPAAAVTQSFETFRREIWLWVNGDRRWGQVAEHLARRVLRRAGQSAPQGLQQAPARCEGVGERL